MAVRLETVLQPLRRRVVAPRGGLDENLCPFENQPYGPHCLRVGHDDQVVGVIPGQRVGRLRRGRRTSVFAIEVILSIVTG